MSLGWLALVSISVATPRGALVTSQVELEQRQESSHDSVFLTDAGEASENCEDSEQDSSSGSFAATVCCAPRFLECGLVQTASMKVQRDGRDAQLAFTARGPPSFA